MKTKITQFPNGFCLNFFSLRIINGFLDYSKLPITQKFRRKSKKVQVIGSLKQITGSKEISKWMGRNCS